MRNNLAQYIPNYSMIDPKRLIDFENTSKVSMNKLMNKVTSWNIILQIFEIKYLLGTNEQVFCRVEIGKKKYSTSYKQIGNLIFNEVI